MAQIKPLLLLAVLLTAGYSTTSNSSNTIVAGNVISQGPAAGTTVDADSAIYFVSPTGPAWVGGTVMIEGCDTGVVNDGRIQAANLLTDRGDIGRDERI